MLVWESYEFAGIAPRFRKKQLPKGFATVAHNVDLTHGSLKAWLEPRHVTNVPSGQAKMHAWGCHVLSWDKCVSVAEWLPDCPRLFVTGNAPYPQTATMDNGRLVYRRLGVLAPNTHPVPTADWVYNDKARAVAYMVTFVNNFGEESGPSPASYDVSIENGQHVHLSLHYNPPIEYDIVSMRIYRRETGFRTGLEKEQEILTHWFLLREVPVGTREFDDTVPIEGLGYAFEGVDTREPPAELSNITAIPESAVLAGSVKNKLLFSRNLQPNSWELSQEMTLDDNIIAMGALNNSLYIATDGHPYRVEADVGCDARECRDIHRYAQAFPMINCHTGHGAVVTPFGLIYASTDGLVLLDDSTNPKVITTAVISQDDWRQMEPHTARLAYHKGALFVVTNKISFILWLDSLTYDDTKHKKMSTISDMPVDMTVTRQGELLFMEADGRVLQWNAGMFLRPYRWVSATIDTGFLFDLTRVRALVRNEDVSVRTLSDRGSIERRFSTGDTTIPFNRHGRVQELWLEIEGTGEVTEVVAGYSGIDMGTKE